MRNRVIWPAFQHSFKGISEGRNEKAEATTEKVTKMEESKYDSVNEDEFSECLPDSAQMQ